MLILFVGIVFAFFIISYVDRQDFTTPSFLLAASFLMAALMFVWNVDNWQVVVYEKTIIYVATAMVAFSVGTILVRLVTGNTMLFDDSVILKQRLDGRSFFVLALISVVCTIVYLAISFRGNISLFNISQLLNIAYVEATSVNKSNIFLNQMKEIPVAIAYVSTFYLLLSKDKAIRMRKVWLIISILSFAVLATFTTDRNIVLRYTIYLVCLWILFYKNRADISMKKKNKVIVRRVLIILAISAVAFYGLGKAKQYTSNFERMIGIYAGSGLYNYNLSIDNHDTLKYGAATFETFINTLKAITGNRSNEVSHGTFITFRSGNGYVYSSNIYSALKPYMQDFGYFGVILYPFILGVFFEILYYWTKRRKYGFTWIFYAMSVYSLLYFSIQEQFFDRFHLGRVYEIFWVVFFYIVVNKIRFRVGLGSSSSKKKVY